MKKFITLVLAVGSFTLVNAQSRKIDEARRVVNGNSRQEDRRVEERGVRYPDTYPSENRSYEIERINRDYDNKIQSVRNNPYLSNEEKARMIRQLEKDRDQRIRSINKAYEGKENKKDKAYKSNNGKHKGWTKGKGNQKNNKKNRYDD